MKTLLYIEMEGYHDGSIYYEVALGTEPSIGRFGPQIRTVNGSSDSFDNAIRDVAKVLQTHPDIQKWAKAQTE